MKEVVGRNTSILSAMRRAASHPKLAFPLIRSAVQQRIVGPAFAHRRPGAVVMFHIGRCGSTVLTEMLEQHPTVYWDGETYGRVLEELRAANIDRRDASFDPGRYVTERFSRSGSRWYGCDVKFFHVTDFGVTIEDYVQAMAESGVSHFVSLRRRNYLRKVISSLIGWERGWYHTRTSPTDDQLQVNIPVDAVFVDSIELSLLEHFRLWDHDYSVLEEAAGSYKLLTLEYERDIEADPTNAFHQVIDFLQLDPFVPEVTLRRVNPQPIEALVENFDDVHRVLSDTEYEWMLRA